MPSTRQLFLLLLVSLALLSNPLWLFPNGGDTQYVYERAELVPRGDSVEFRPEVPSAHTGYANDIQGVGCDGGGEVSGRTCAFEQALADDGNHSVTAYDGHLDGAVPYVELVDGYYHRVSTADGATAQLGLERVPAGAVLANVSATSGLGETELAGIERSRVAARAIVSGEPVVRTQPPSAVNVGLVYALDGRYYAVFVTGSEQVDHPLISQPLRFVAEFVGVVGVLSAVVLLLGRSSIEEW